MGMWQIFTRNRRTVYKQTDEPKKRRFPWREYRTRFLALRLNPFRFERVICKKGTSIPIKYCATQGLKYQFFITISAHMNRPRRDIYENYVKQLVWVFKLLFGEKTQPGGLFKPKHSHTLIIVPFLTWSQNYMLITISFWKKQLNN